MNTQAKIRILPQVLINRIAAGEVVERPASVVKELVENSIDAGAKNIEVFIENGGKNLIRIKDDGQGINKEDLSLCVKRYATSKLPEEDLFNINSYGFRGEALPSIASISRFKIISKKFDSNDAWEINIEGGEEKEIKPANLSNGTLIEVKDLFYATPARLKFLKTDTTEKAKIIEVIEKISLSNPKINFIFHADTKKILELKSDLISESENSLEKRVENLLGKDFFDNSIKINSKRGNAEISGFISLPTFNCGNSLQQYLFVNNRPVKDKVLVSALRVGYMDFMARDRFPISVIFINLPPHEVDVNVHPAKSEVRFLFEQEIRGMLIGTIKNALNENSKKTSTTISSDIINYFKPEEIRQNFDNKLNEKASEIISFDYYKNEKSKNNYAQNINIFSSTPLPPQAKIIEASPQEIQVDNNKFYPLGFAKAQLHGNYILSQTEAGFILVDMHAAHERITYEKLKIQYEQRGIRSLKLLLPEIIELSEANLEKLLEKKIEFEKFGLVFEKFSNQAIEIKEIPEILENQNIKKLITEILDDLIETGEQLKLSEKIEHILETFACHTSIRNGRILNIDEMNALLREMENTPNSGQCNHGRPTYIKLELKDLEKLFERT
jgi:DNA mismatch repair protein MutL